MSAITDSARGKDCLIRFPGYPHLRETVTHNHRRKNGAGGTGIKPHDLLGARGCYDCHRIVDGRDLTAEERQLDPEYVDQMFRNGIVSTIEALVRERVV